MSTDAQEKTQQREVRELYVKSKTRSLRISMAILILAGIAYAVTAVFLDLTLFGPLTIVLVLALLMEVAARVLKYRYKKGLLGNNETEARELIEFAFRLHKNNSK